MKPHQKFIGTALILFGGNSMSQILVDDFSADLYRLGDAFSPYTKVANVGYKASFDGTTTSSNDKASTTVIENYAQLQEITGQSIESSIRVFSGLLSAKARLGYINNNRRITETNTIYYALYMTREYSPERTSSVSLNDVGRDIQKAFPSEEEMFRLMGRSIIYQIQRRISIGYMYKIKASSSEAMNSIRSRLSAGVTWTSGTAGTSSELEKEIKTIDNSVQIEVQAFQIGVNSEHPISMAASAKFSDAPKIISEAIQNLRYQDAMPHRIWVKNVHKILSSGLVILDGSSDAHADVIDHRSKANQLIRRAKIIVDLLYDLESNSKSNPQIREQIAALEKYITNTSLKEKEKDSVLDPPPQVSLAFVKDLVYLSDYPKGPFQITRWGRGSGTMYEIFDGLYEVYPVMQIINTNIIQLIDRAILKNTGNTLKIFSPQELQSMLDKDNKISFRGVLYSASLPDFKDFHSEFGSGSETRVMPNRFQFSGIYSYAGNDRQDVLNSTKSRIISVLDKHEKARNYVLSILLVDGSQVDIKLGNAFDFSLPRIN